MTENWLPIPGYDGYYEVSDQGRVKSLHRATAAPVPRAPGRRERTSGSTAAAW